MRAVLVVAVIAVLAAPAGAGQLPRTLGLHPPRGPALAMVDSKIEVSVRGPIVEAVVTQRFANRTDHATEATYIFPLPRDAAVSAMAIETGGRTIHAKIATRADAQRRYEAAVRAGVRAALLDQERPDVFTQTVSAIPPRATVDITLRFDALARYQGGTWELVLPLVVAPRYVPGRATNQPTTGTGRTPDTDRAPDASRVTPAGKPGAGGATEVVIRFFDKPAGITSPTHELTVASNVARFVDPRTDHDAIVRWRQAAPGAGWVERAGGEAYAAVVVEAPPPPRRKGSLRCLLVLDRSAASRGDAEAIARPVIRTLLGALTAADRVAVTGSDHLAWAAPADIARALDRVWARPAGAFDLTRVLRAARPGGAPIVLVSGGLVADDRAAIAAARALGVAIHVIGVGPAPARGLLAQLAAASGGTLRFAVPGDDLDALIAGVLADAAGAPAPLTVTWGTLAAYEVVPGTLPRLGAGQATLVLARVKRAHTANARARGDVFAIEVLPPPRAVEGAITAMGPLARRWAKLRLDELLQARASANVVTRHALRYGLVSPYTSLVAVGTEVVVRGGVKRSIAVPVAAPAGMKWRDVQRQTTVEVDANEPAPDQAAGGARTRDGKPNVAGEVKVKDKAVAARRADAAPPPPPEPAGAPDNLGVDRSHAEDGDADDEQVEETRARPARIAATSLEADIIAISGTPAGRRWRISAGLGSGLLRTRGATSALLTINARLERAIAPATLVGLDGALWLIDGRDAAGKLLVSFARAGIARWLELGAGAGLSFGDGTGPAGAIHLRLHLPPLPRAALYLRYDAALLNDGGDRRGEHTGTLGLELGF